MENNKELMGKISSKPIMAEIISLADTYVFFEVTYAYSKAKKEEASEFLRDYSAAYLLNAPKNMNQSKKEKLMGRFHYCGFSKDELQAVKNFLYDDFTKNDAEILGFNKQLEVY